MTEQIFLATDGLAGFKRWCKIRGSAGAIGAIAEARATKMKKRKYSNSLNSRSIYLKNK